MYTLLIILGAAAVASALSDYVQYMKQKYDTKFLATCPHYPFVQQYADLLQTGSERYMVFSFHEPGQKAGAGGGWGDRLAGMITAFAYSLRTNRTFIIQGDHALNKLFRPYPFSGASNVTRSWSDRTWTKWEPHFHNDMHKMSCVNPGRQSTICALDSIDSDVNKHKIIHFTGNRCYLCRWLKLALPNQESIHSILGIDEKANLYEIAGCLLRLILHPTPALWQEVDAFMRNITLPGTMLSKQKQQIGVHFRCGDSSFSNAKDSPPNPECVWSASRPWQGTRFADDHTIDSPIDLARCVNQSISRFLNYSGEAVLQQSVPSQSIQSHPVVFIASDNLQSADQVVGNIAARNILLPREVCHIDHQAHHHCTENTLVQWFALSLSDVLITQEMDAQRGDSPYSDPLAVRATVEREGPAPISAFSRFAAIYGLSSHELRYGHCKVTDPIALSHYTHGNWMCTPKIFF